MKKIITLITTLSIIINSAAIVNAKEIERTPDGAIKYSSNDVILEKAGDSEKITILGYQLEISDSEPDELTLKSNFLKKYWIDCENPYLIYFDIGKMEIIKENFELKISYIWDYDANKVFDYETNEELGYIYPKQENPVVLEPKDEISSEGKITDLNEICKILTEYAAEFFPKARIYIQENKKVTFSTNSVYNSETYKIICDFVDNTGIDSSLVCIAVYGLAENDDVFDTAVDGTLGDINSDGKIDISDLSELSLVLVGDSELTSDQLSAADIDGNGKADLSDLARLKQYISKVITSL